jgi:D-alanyl-D-alanine carboxypeptidase
MCFFLSLFSIFSSSFTKDSQAQYINKSYIVLDALTNKVIEGKEINLVRSVASVSKIMTAIVAIENGDLQEEVTITKEDIDTYGSSIDLVYGLMLRSGNDASKSIARVVGGSEDNFVAMMNKKANEIGMKNSTFNNPSGLDVNEEGNLSTSYDLAILMSYAIKNETFLTISGSKEYKSYKGTWANKNKLLTNYKYTIAGKTGFTYKAKRTLVTASKNNETTLVVVTLDCGNDFNYHKYLYEKNFNKYQSELLLSKGDNYLDDYLITCSKPIYLTLEKDKLNQYSILYSIDSNYVKVYLSIQDNTQQLDECKITKNENITSKKSKFNKLKEFFNNLFR